MQAGLSRAIPMAILGFMFGALLTILIRGLQGLDPIWASGPGIILSAITMAGFFVWGMGAFDPKLSVHGDEEIEEAVHEELAEESTKPRGVLFGTSWQLATVVVVLFIILLGFAALPNGLAMTQTVVPGASTTLVGYMPLDLPFGGPTVQVSTFVVFAAFVIWAFVSLVAAAAVIGYLIFYTSRGITEVKMAGAGTLALPAPAEEAPPSNPRQTVITFVLVIVTFVVACVFFKLLIDLIAPQFLIPGVSLIFDNTSQVTILAVIFGVIVTLLVFKRERVRMVAPFIFTFWVLHLFFYFVAIGLILPNPSLPVLTQLNVSNPVQLTILSAVNAFLFTFIILRPTLLLHTIGRIARWLAYVLRHVPHFLQ